jgi:hypothetical protein
MNTSPPTQPTPPTTIIPGHILLPIYEFIPLMIGSKEFSIVNITLAKQIHAADPQENFCHVEYPTQYNQQVLPRVWYKRNWETDYAKTRSAWIKAEERRIRQYFYDELVLSIRDQLLKRLPGLDKLMAFNTAKEIIDKKNLDAAKAFGVVGEITIDEAVVKEKMAAFMKEARIEV